MGIGTSLGAYFEDSFHHQAGIDTQDENEHSSEGIKHDDTPIPVADKEHGTYVGDVNEDHPEYKDWSSGWDQAIGLKGRNPEDVMKTYPSDTEGSTYHYSTPIPGEQPPYDKGDLLYLRKKPQPKEGDSVPVSSIDPGLIHQVANRIDVYKGDAPKEPPNIEDVREPDFVDKLFGTNGAERYPLWPERMARDMLSSAHDVGTGKVPMWSMDPETGDMHTSIDGLEAAHKLMPAANGGGFPLKIQLHPEAVDALSEGPNAFQQFMAARGRNQSSNIIHDLEPEETARLNRPAPTYDEAVQNSSRVSQDLGHSYPVRGPNEDSTSFAIRSIRHVLDHGPESQGHPMDPETAANRYHNLPSGDNIRFAHEYEEHATDAQWDRYEHLVNDPNRQVPFAHGLTENDLVDWGGHDRIDTSVLSRRRIDEAKQDFEERPDDVVKKGNIALLKSPYQSHRNSHTFKFLSDKGIPGELTVRLKNGDKEINVGWIGTIGTPGPMDVGRSEMKNLFKLLSEQFPKAETITGFRVSGARAQSGLTGDAAMKIPGREK